MTQFVRGGFYFAFAGIPFKYFYNQTVSTLIDIELNEHIKSKKAMSDVFLVSSPVPASLTGKARSLTSLEFMTNFPIIGTVATLSGGNLL